MEKKDSTTEGGTMKNKEEKKQGYTITLRRPRMPKIDSTQILVSVIVIWISYLLISAFTAPVVYEPTYTEVCVGVEEINISTAEGMKLCNLTEEDTYGEFQQCLIDRFCTKYINMSEAEEFLWNNTAWRQ
jgi:hypothetical protein